jgi:hypothetical protein
MKMIPLTQGKFAKVDDGDFEFLVKHKWCVLTGKSHRLYAARYKKQNKKMSIFLMHRVVTSAPVGLVVDHINGDGLDNRRSNLRVCSMVGNIQNSKIRSDNTTGYKGVYYRKSKGKYISGIMQNGKRIYLGSFETAEEAARAYDQKARELFGPLAWLNFPEK